MREARNGGEFLKAVEERTGIRAQVIAGVEEARLIHKAAVYGVDASSGTTVVIDIGGGSMEVTLGTATDVHLARSSAARRDPADRPIRLERPAVQSATSGASSSTSVRSSANSPSS